MSRKTRPYLFYNTTASVCTTCLRRVEAKILIKGDDVFLEKWCPTHGFERVLVSDDAAYYRWCREVFVKVPEMPEFFNTKMEYGCPLDCGLCPDHMQHSCLTVLEVGEHCNLHCPVCYASSSPDKMSFHSLETIEKMLDTVVKNEGAPDVVQLSGGEPTLHPQFFEIIEAARIRPIKHLMLNTNGIKIAKDIEFARKLGALGAGFEVYLQFDGMDDEVNQALRGADLHALRLQALAHLNQFNVSTTLVMTVAEGVNLDQVGDVIAFAQAQDCVRGVTLQPLSDSGRQGVASSAPLSVSKLRREIANQSSLFTQEDILPVPCNPDTLAMAYALKNGSTFTPITRHITPEMLLGGKNTIVFERDEALKDSIIKLLATNLSPEMQADCISQLLCCLPQIVNNEGLSYENVFRVLIVQFMDARNLDLRALKKSCVHMVSTDGKMIPFETYNLFYREGLQHRLADLRAGKGVCTTEV